MPGFALARKAADIYESRPAVEGLILHKHGIFTFGENARDAYERMIALVSLAELRLTRTARWCSSTAQLPQAIAPVAAVAPILRGACSLRDDISKGAWRRLILEFRTGPAILNFVNGAELARYSQAGVVTPDHAIRTKNWPLVVAPPEEGKMDDFGRAVRKAVDAFIERYHAYFTRQNARVGGLGKCSIRCRGSRWCRASACSGSGDPRRTRASPPISPLPQSKPSPTPRRSGGSSPFPKPRCSTWNTGRWSRQSSANAKELPLAGQIAVITGAAGTIGAATATTFAAAGAEVVLLDLDEAGVKEKAGGDRRCGARPGCDVTDRLRCSEPSIRWWKPSVASTSSCPMRARPGRAGSARSRKNCCARASS